VFFEESSGTTCIAFLLHLQVKAVGKLIDVAGTFFNECGGEQGDEFKVSLVEFEEGLNFAPL
jgi:hypothetical protein